MVPETVGCCAFGSVGWGLRMPFKRCAGIGFPAVESILGGNQFGVWQRRGWPQTGPFGRPIVWQVLGQIYLANRGPPFMVDALHFHLWPTPFLSICDSFSLFHPRSARQYFGRGLELINGDDRPVGCLGRGRTHDENGICCDTILEKEAGCAPLHGHLANGPPWGGRRGLATV